jgi:glycosyltransferase involved in cell wall biosynthesis
MRILLVSYYFAPFNTVGALRPTRMAEYLRMVGHDLTVLTCANPPYLVGLETTIPPDAIHATREWSVLAPVVWSAGGKEKVATQGFYRGLRSGRLAQGLARLYRAMGCWPDGQMGWGRSALREGRRLLTTQSFDCIVASAPPWTCLRVAATLAREFGLPWVADMRDLWSDNHAYSLPRWRRAVDQRWEAQLLSQAAAISTVSPPLAQKLSRFARPVWVIRNGFSEEDFSDLPQVDGFSQPGVHVVFTGNIYPEQYDCDAFCAGLAICLARGQAVHVHVAGRNIAGLQQAARRHGVTVAFRFAGTLPHSHALAMQRQADVLLTFLWGDGTEQGIYTAKLFEYAGAGRPILAVGPSHSDVGDFIARSGLGRVAGDAAQVASILQELAAGSYQQAPSDRRLLHRDAQFALFVQQLAALHARVANRRDGARVCFVVNTHFALNAFLSGPIAALDRAGWQVTVVVNFASGPVDADISAHAVLVHAPIARPIAPFADLLALWRLWRIFRQGRFRVVHTVTPKAGFLGMVAAWVARVPIRAHTFTGQIWVNRGGFMRRLLYTVDRAIAFFATHMLADSQSQRDFLLKHRVGRPGQMGVLGQGSICGVDTQRFAPDLVARAEVRQELGLADNDIVILFLGRLHPEKGLHELFSAYQQLAAIHTGLRLLLVGPDEGGLPLLARLGAFVHPGVRRLGLTNTPQRFMAAADVFCLPSYREGFGLTLVEAAAVGLPVVSTRIYGVTDAVQDGVMGLLVAPGDVVALQRALEKLVSAPALRRQYGAAGRQIVSKHFSHEYLLSCWLDWYNDHTPFGG